MIKRFGLYGIAVLVLGFGIVLNTKAGLGVGSINTFPYAVSEITPLSLGMATTLLYFVFVIAQMFIYKKMDMKILLQIPFSYVMGMIIDFYDEMMDFTVGNFLLKLAVLAVAIVATAAGAFVMVSMEIIPNPADGMAKAAGYALHKEFGEGKLIFDCVMILITAVISLVFARRIIGIGLGTVLSAFFIGRLIRLFGRAFGSRMKAVVEESRRKSAIEEGT
ncbi:MAG: DUF6198 family protein [Blautia sp.]|nr:DUF6198 family protein [Blautia sp.]MCM1202421.1 DUF6198 family protein [Bacteroides fragilis]